MISRSCIITVNGNTANIDSDVFLYKNDKNIQLTFSIINSKYMYDNDDSNNLISSMQAAYAQVKFKKVDSEDIEIEFDIQETKKGAVLLTISEELTDEDTELGDYTIQIRLLDSNKNAVITLPPVESCIHILKPLFEKLGSDTNVVNKAEVNKAVATYSVALSATNEDGTYNKKTWVEGDKITTGELNRIEDGIDNVSTQYKDIANKTVVENNKLYLVKSDGTKLDEGTELNIPSNNIMTLTQEQYDELISNGKIIINGTEHIYNENIVYNISNPQKIQLYDSNGISYFIEIKDGKLSLTEPIGTSEILPSVSSIEIIEGNSSSFYVKLDEQPIGKQTVNISSPSENIVVSPSSIEFTTENWSDDVVITITVNNGDYENNNTFNLTLSSTDVESKVVEVNVVDSSSDRIITLYDNGVVPNGELSLISCNNKETYLEFIKSASSKIAILNYPLSLKCYDRIYFTLGKCDNVVGSTNYSFQNGNIGYWEIGNNKQLIESLLYKNFDENGMCTTYCEINADKNEYNFEFTAYFGLCKVYKIFIVRGE